MKIKSLTLLFLFTIFNSSDAYSQTEQSLVITNSEFQDKKITLNYTTDYTQFKASRFILPAALITTGVVTRYTGLDWADRKVQEESQRKWHTSTKIDDGLLFVPYAAVYGLSFCGIEPIHNFKDRTIVMGTSAVLAYGMTTALKNTSNRWRPDGDDKKSFPSGHTALAFAGAHVLMKEYRHVSPWIGIGGYAVATSVGYLRITNNRHWLSDVVAGAGFGILGTELAYLLLPYISEITPFASTNKNLSLAPYSDSECTGLAFQYAF